MVLLLIIRFRGVEIKTSVAFGAREQPKRVAVAESGLAGDKCAAKSMKCCHCVG